MDLHGRNLLKVIDFTREEFLYVVDLAGRLREEKRVGHRPGRLSGRNIALIFEKASTRTRSAFEVAAHDEGAHVTYLGPGDTHLGRKESVKDTARVLGRMFDGIEFRGSSQDVELLGAHAGVPVWNGLTDVWHPTQMLADVLTMCDHSRKPLGEVSFCYLGDGNDARSPASHWGPARVRCSDLRSGYAVTVTRTKGNGVGACGRVWRQTDHNF